MKKRRKSIVIAIPLCIIGVLAALCGWGYSRLSIQEEKADIDLYSLIPTDCRAILETKDVNALCKTIHGAYYVQEQGLPNVSYLLNEFIQHIEALASKQAHGLSTEMNSQLLVSFHQPGSTHDQVIYGRMGEGDMSLITQQLLQDKGATHAPKKLMYRGETITIYTLGREFVACYFKQGFFAISLQEKLIEQVIDALLEGKSAEKWATLDALRKQTKHNEQLSLYYLEEEAWRHFEIRMSADAIYLTSNQPPHRASNNEKMEHHIPVERTDGNLLPLSVKVMTQSALPHTLHSTHMESSTKPNLSQILGELEVREVTSVLFSPTDTTLAGLLILPLEENKHTALRQALRHPLRAVQRPSVWRNNQATPIWQCEVDTTLASLLIQPCTSLGLPAEWWISVSNSHLLMSTNRETLKSYIVEKHTNTVQVTGKTNLHIFKQCLADLAEEADYTLVANMNYLIKEGDKFTSTWSDEFPMMTTFSARYPDFFKHFMLSTQYISQGEETHTQLILSFHREENLSY